ncbi:MAG: WecB/TagA/CpsF family glycosyltransferase [Prevotella ruminicola]|jgi:N-acetylglucosaminyldiphosphoundecaprenol N-acetyl-beta-D-mannosaminyltransferase|uniref:WecB/TagA/CpsF family glycosyltransferase n=1 Tax=Xylanibacter ruminicola TaxID=839 RepID=A0A9D5P231_XYLRU|nr:WecB/TagA/CpsF family glycosyltransferase [Xylanibacter ruminicola]
MLRLSDIQLIGSKEELAHIPEGKVLINTINAHSYNVAQVDEAFAQALKASDGKYLIPDGVAIVKACKWLKAKSQPKERIAGWNLFSFEMLNLGRKSEKLKVNSEKRNEKCRVMFMGSSERVLKLIRERCKVDYPNLEVVTYSPPYKAEFSEEENREIIRAINEAHPDLLWIGMTAPKQEKWTWQHWQELDIDCHVGTIGAVFDFYAGTVKRAPMWFQQHGLEWLYRLAKEPKRMWRRYVIGNPLFVWNILKEYYGKKE